MRNRGRTASLNCMASLNSERDVGGLGSSDPSIKGTRGATFLFLPKRKSGNGG